MTSWGGFFPVFVLANKPLSKASCAADNPCDAKYSPLPTNNDMPASTEITCPVI